MKKRFYVWHRWLGLVACLAVIPWSLTGVLHPIMSWTQPRPANMFLKKAPLQPDAFKISLVDALARNNIGVIKSLNIVSLDSNTYYQVEPRDAGAPVYLNIIDGEPLADGDRRYAVFLARYFLNDTTSPVKSIERVTKFSADYQKVNRLLPAWRVNFERPDGMRAYVDTTSSRLGTLVNNRKG